MRWNRVRICARYGGNHYINPHYVFLSHYHKYDNVRETEYDDLDSHITYVNAISFLLASLAMFKLSAIPIHQQPS